MFVADKRKRRRGGKNSTHVYLESITVKRLINLPHLKLFERVLLKHP